MKKLLSFVFVILFVTNYYTQQISSKISEVIVYKNQAQVTRVFNYQFEKGEKEMVLDGISTSIIPASLQISSNSKSIELLSAKYENNYLKDQKEHSKIVAIKKNKQDITDKLNNIKDQILTLDGLLAIYNANKSLEKSENGFSSTQISEIANSYKKNYLNILEEKRNLTKQKTLEQEKINNINNQLNEANRLFKKPSGNIILSINSTLNGNASFEIKYVVNNATWVPVYDLNSDGFNKPIILKQKASITQNTGVNWENIKMIVSTGNPSDNQNIPSFSPLYVHFNSLQNFALPGRNSRGDAEDVEYSGQEVLITKDQTVNGYADNNAFQYKASVNEQSTTIEYEIDSKQNILSDNKQHLISLTKNQLNASYQYISYPRKSKSAYLSAQIRDWSALNLSSGNANVFFEGKFIGTSYVNFQSTDDTLNVSLGKDASINVSRVLQEAMCSKKTIGSNKTEKLAYKISVKNTKSSPISIQVFDQIPVSTNSQINVELTEKDKATFNAKTGELKWDVKLKASQTEDKDFSYTVKFPKNKQISQYK